MSPRAPLGQVEFVGLMAVLFACVAFSIDAMLPAFPEIAAELAPDAPNRAQLILTAFILGMGLGTFVTGPLSDSFGRKPVILGGLALYLLGAALAAVAPTLETVLAARMLQGLGAAAPRIVAIALVRDQYEGRAMARIMSFVMMVFTLIPAVAPLMGSFIIAGFGWRGIFGAFVLFGLFAGLWLSLRQPETLPAPLRRPFRPRELARSTREILGNRTIVTAIAVLTLAFAALFATLSSTQQVFDRTFGKADSFPAWFAVIAVLAGTGSLLNSQIVMRLGMRRVVTGTLIVQTAVSAAVALAFRAGWLDGNAAFAVHVAWTTGVFFMAGLVFGNLNALALEPVGHIAGLASSVVGAVSTVVSVLVAAPIGLAFDGTPAPLATGIALCCGAGAVLMRSLPGRTAR